MKAIHMTPIKGYLPPRTHQKLREKAAEWNKSVAYTVNKIVSDYLNCSFDTQTRIYSVKRQKYEYFEGEDD